MGFSWMLNIDFISAVIVIVILWIIIYKNKDKLTLEKVLFPFIYGILYRTKFGLTAMDKIAQKYKEFIKFIGYCFIGLGFSFMIVYTYIIVKIMIDFFVMPKQVDTGMALILPGVNVPGFGVLSFWHWIIAIFILLVMHEGAHGIMARAHNVKVKSSGFAFFAIFIPLLPGAFVEPDENQLKKQPDHVQYSIYAAGPMVNILVALILVFAFPWVNPFNVNSDLAPYENHFSDANGFLVNVLEGTPAYNASIKNGMVIQSLNGENVDDFDEFSTRMMKIGTNEQVTLDVYNGTNKLSFTFFTAEHPQIPSMGYVGISPIKNQRVIKQEHKLGGAVFYWFKGLFMWLFLFNYGIGIMNLLPLGIVDGGRMMQVAFKSIFKDKKKARGYWALISFILLILLLVGILAHYLKGWGIF